MLFRGHFDRPSHPAASEDLQTVSVVSVEGQAEGVLLPVPVGHDQGPHNSQQHQILVVKS